MSFSKKTIIILLLIISLALLSGCKGSTKTVDMQSTIGISSSDNIGITKKVIEDVVSKAQADGLNITVLDAQGDKFLQKQHIEEFIDAGYTTIVICPVDSQDIKDSIALAVQNDIKVVLFEKEIDDPNVSFFAGFDSFEQGNTAAQAILEIDSGNPVTILEVVGPSDNINAVEISKGFHDIIDAHNNLEVIRLESNWSVQSTYDGVKSSFINNPTIDMILCTDSRLDYAIDAALDEMGLLKTTASSDHIYRISIGGSKNGYDSAIAGYVDLLLITDAQEISNNLYDAVKLLNKNKSLEQTEFISKTYELSQEQVEKNKESVWGYTSNIE